MRPASKPGSAQALQLVELLPAAPVPAAPPVRPLLPPRPAEEEPARPLVPPRPAAEEPARPLELRPAAEEPARPLVPPRPAVLASGLISSTAASRSRSPVPGRSCDFEHPTSSSALTAPNVRPIVRPKRERVVRAPSSRVRCRLIAASSGCESVSATRPVKAETEIILGCPLCENDDESSAWDRLI